MVEWGCSSLKIERLGANIGNRNQNCVDISPYFAISKNVVHSLEQREGLKDMCNVRKYRKNF